MGAVKPVCRRFSPHVACVAALLLAPLAAFAAEGWFFSDDRSGLRAFAGGHYRLAASQFEDPAWKAVALHRQGRFLSAARLLEASPAVRDRYNRATSLALAGQLKPAIRLYEALLEEHPGHADARHNLEVLKRQGADAGAALARQDALADNSTVDSALSASEVTEAVSPELENAIPGAPLLPEQTQRWLRQVPDDPGGLLRRKFQRQYRALGVDQDGRALWPGEPGEPW